MTDPRLARLRAAVEEMRTLATAWSSSYARAKAEAYGHVLELLDTEAGEPEPDKKFFRVFTAQPCTRCGGTRDWAVDGQLQAVCHDCGNPKKPATPPPSDARERLVLTNNGHLAVLDNQVAALTARVEAMEQGVEIHARADRLWNETQDRRLAALQLTELKKQATERAAPSGDAAQEEQETDYGTDLAAMAGVDAPTPEPAPASAWPSEAAMRVANYQSRQHASVILGKNAERCDCACGHFFLSSKQLDADSKQALHWLERVLCAAYAEDVPQIERAAEERGFKRGWKEAMNQANPPAQGAPHD